MKQKWHNFGRIVLAVMLPLVLVLLLLSINQSEVYWLEDMSGADEIGEIYLHLGSWMSEDEDNDRDDNLPIESPPDWVERVWDLHDVTYYQGSFYVSLHDNNTAHPTNTNSWSLFHRFIPDQTVPWFENQVPSSGWSAGDFVRANFGINTYYFFNEPAPGLPSVPITPATGVWQQVFKFSELAGIRKWSATNQYSIANTLVMHNNEIYRLMGTWAPLGTQPSLAPFFWERILTWEETQRPIAWVDGIAATGPMFFELDSEFFVLINETWAGHTLDPRIDPRFRPVRLFDEFTAYTAFQNLTWGIGIAHTYTIDETTGRRKFWQFNATPGGPTTITGEIPGVSTFWQPFDYFTRRDIVITLEGDTYVVWDATVSLASNTNLGEPSDSNPNWQRRLITVDENFTFTTEPDGRVTLWRNNLTNGNISRPGNNTDWTQVPFQTFANYFYTVDSQSVIRFWFTPNRSSENPNINHPDWEMIGSYLGGVQ